jgi:transglutaminase-like putative cysteine protease
MDLTDYTCRGFSGDFDRLMRNIPVAGIDRLQTHSMIRLCDATEPILYGPDFSPRRIRYRRGSRPRLEMIAADLTHDPAKALAWVRDHVRHPHLAGDVPPNRAMTEEQLIDSGRGWCNEQCRVFIALCEVMEAPARLCFLFHADGRTGHTATEIWHAGKWAMHDVTHGVTVSLAGRKLAEGRDLQGAHRRLADGYYRASLTEYYRDRTAPFDLSRGGDLFHGIGICNYLIDGVEAV